VTAFWELAFPDIDAFRQILFGCSAVD